MEWGRKWRFKRSKLIPEGLAIETLCFLPMFDFTSVHWSLVHPELQLSKLLQGSYILKKTIIQNLKLWLKSRKPPSRKEIERTRLDLVISSFRCGHIFITNYSEISNYFHMVNKKYWSNICISLNCSGVGSQMAQDASVLQNILKTSISWWKVVLSSLEWHMNTSRVGSPQLPQKMLKTGTRK